RRRGGLVLHQVPRPRHLRRVAVRDDRHRGRGPARAAGGGRRSGGPAGPEGRRLRRARRRPGVRPLLPPGRAGLRVLLAVPGAGGAPGGRPRGDRGGGLGDALTAPGAASRCPTPAHRVMRGPGRGRRVNGNVAETKGREAAAGGTPSASRRPTRRGWPGGGARWWISGSRPRGRKRSRSPAVTPRRV